LALGQDVEEAIRDLIVIADHPLHGYFRSAVSQGKASGALPVMPSIHMCGLWLVPTPAQV
jgi:hypothetical protein